MSRSHQHHKTAFTLIELLVVISIIGILMGLLIPTIRGVMMRAEVTRIVMEIKQLESGLEAYKKQFDDYPPDFTDPRVVVRHARKAFPRISDNEINKLLLKVYGVNLQDLVSSGPTVWNIDPAEALVFWLSGFSEDVTQPFFGSGGPFSAGTRNKGVYDFDSTRLFEGDDGDPYPVYLPRTFELPYVFFDARTYQHLGPGGVPRYPPPGPAIKKQTVGPSAYHRGLKGILRPYKTKSQVAGVIKWNNETTFQILAAGIGDDFGGSVGNGLRSYPSGNNFDKGDKKNIANFSGGQLGDSTQ